MNHKTNLIIHLLIVGVLLCLPYYLFQGKLFIGGDDTRLFYIFPQQFITNLAFFSWYTFSSVGSYNPNHFLLPLVSSNAILQILIPSKVIIDYLFFSLPFILGYIYFQKLAILLIPSKSKTLIAIIGSLFYIFSPIIVYNQMSIFLYAVWVVPLLPTVGYYFIKYIRTNEFQYIIKNTLLCVFFSLGFYSIPWLLGALIPIFFGGLLFLLFYSRNTIINFFIRSSIFFFFVFLSQCFWVLPFMMTFIQKGSNYGSQILSQDTTNTFTNTVLSTASGSIIFPLLNLFHRQIAFDYHWELEKTFQQYYDNFLIINVIYIIVVFGGIFYAKKVLSKENLKTFLGILSMFSFSLFLFTVNIGVLKYVFLAFSFFPGIAMFRNFYDKFAVGYVFIFALLFTFCLSIIVSKYSKQSNIIYGVLVAVIIVNFLPVKEIVVRQLWRTENTYSIISVPQEYLHFMKNVANTLPPSATIVSLPYNIASYTFIKDTNTNNVFAGTSPVKIFTGINDYSGNLSFPPSEGVLIDRAFRTRDVSQLQNLFEKYGISHLFITKNIPNDVKNSYLFHKNVMLAHDDSFVNSISKKQILSSSKGNYQLYELNTKTKRIQGTNVTFSKINNVIYLVSLRNVSKKATLQFIDSYHTGWKLFGTGERLSFCRKIMDNECIRSQQLIMYEEFRTIWEKPLFENTHKMYKTFGNTWEIDIEKIKNERYVTKNTDGTYDVQLLLYFTPQIYFYVGVALTVGSIIVMFVILHKEKRRHR